MRYKTIAQFSRESGYSEDAVRGKIRDGTWLECKVWRRAPDGHILIDTEGFFEWVENGNGLASKPSPQAQSRSRSRTRESSAASGSSCSPPPLT